MVQLKVLILIFKMKYHHCIPIILCSGAGSESFVEASKIKNISALAAGNYFNFKELSYKCKKIKRIKHLLDNIMAKSNIKKPDIKYCSKCLSNKFSCKFTI